MYDVHMVAPGFFIWAGQAGVTDFQRAGPVAHQNCLSEGYSDRFIKSFSSFWKKIQRFLLDFKFNLKYNKNTISIACIRMSVFYFQIRCYTKQKYYKFVHGGSAVVREDFRMGCVPTCRLHQGYTTPIFVAD